MIAGQTVESLDRLFQTLDPDDLVDIPSGIGFCMLMNRSVLNEIGYFDEETFGRGYGEENDWCLRAWKKGYRSVHLQNLFVYHRGNASFGAGSEALKAEHMAALYRKHPGYRAEVAGFIRRDPAKRNREAVRQMAAAR
jgi:GT2 family glycosyltransferase